MLKKKMLRDIKSNYAQFFSIFILAVVAMWCFTGFQSDVIGGRRAMSAFSESSNFSDGWIYGSGFDIEQADRVKATPLGHCTSDTQSNFSSDWLNLPQEY